MTCSLFVPVLLFVIHPSAAFGGRNAGDGVPYGDLCPDTPPGVSGSTRPRVGDTRGRVSLQGDASKRVGATLAVVPVRTTKRRTKLKFPRSCPPSFMRGQDRGFFDSLDNFPGGYYFPRYRVGRMIAVSSVSSSPFQAAMKRISAFLIRYPRLPRSASCCWHFWESLTARLLSQSR